MISLLDPSRSGPHTVVAVAGELDVDGAPSLRDTLLALLNRGVDSLVVDMRAVTFLDSTGAGSLLRLHHRQELLGGRIHFVVGPGSVRRVLDLTQLSRRLHVTSTVADVSECCPPGPVADLEPQVASR